MKNMHLFDVKTLKAKGGGTRKPATTLVATTLACPGPAMARPSSSTLARPTCTTPPSM